MFDTFLTQDLARRKLNYTIMGRLNPTALAMTDDDIRSFVTEHAPEIRDEFQTDDVAEEDLQEQVILALSRWLPLHIKDWGGTTTVELKDILYLSKRFYPGGARPDMNRDLDFKIGGSVRNTKISIKYNITLIITDGD